MGHGIKLGGDRLLTHINQTTIQGLVIFTPDETPEAQNKKGKGIDTTNQQ
jgi:hypothetical protein